MTLFPFYELNLKDWVVSEENSIDAHFLVTWYRNAFTRSDEISTIIVFTFFFLNLSRFGLISFSTRFSMITSNLSSCRLATRLVERRILDWWLIRATLLYGWTRDRTVDLTAQVMSSLEGPRNKVKGLSIISLSVTISVEKWGTWNVFTTSLITASSFTPEKMVKALCCSCVQMAW